MNESAQITNKILEKDLCYKIQGCIYGVANKYGKGLKENIYQNALTEEFQKNNLKTEGQKRINVYSFDIGKKLGVYVPDFVIENRVVLEIKATTFTTKQDLE